MDHARLPRRGRRLPDRRVPVLRSRLQGNSNVPAALGRPTLPNRNYQYEFALPTLQSRGSRSHPGRPARSRSSPPSRPITQRPRAQRTRAGRTPQERRTGPCPIRRSVGRHAPARPASSMRRSCSRARISGRPTSNGSSARSGVTSRARRDAPVVLPRPPAARRAEGEGARHGATDRAHHALRPGPAPERRHPVGHRLDVRRLRLPAHDRQHVVQQAPQRLPQSAQRAQGQRSAHLPADRPGLRAAGPALGLRDGPEQRALDLPRRSAHGDDPGRDLARRARLSPERRGRAGRSARAPHQPQRRPGRERVRRRRARGPRRRPCARRAAPRTRGAPGPAVPGGDVLHRVAGRRADRGDRRRRAAPCRRSRPRRGVRRREDEAGHALLARADRQRPGRAAGHGTGEPHTASGRMHAGQIPTPRWSGRPTSSGRDSGGGRPSGAPPGGAPTTSPA